METKDREMATKDREMATKDREMAAKDREMAIKDREMAAKVQQIQLLQRRVADVTQLQVSSTISMKFHVHLYMFATGIQGNRVKRRAAKGRSRVQQTNTVTSQFKPSVWNFMFITVCHRNPGKRS